jgi:hypothetical protein
VLGRQRTATRRFSFTRETRNPESENRKNISPRRRQSVYESRGEIIESGSAKPMPIPTVSLVLRLGPAEAKREA